MSEIIDMIIKKHPHVSRLISFEYYTEKEKELSEEDFKKRYFNICENDVNKYFEMSVEKPTEETLTILLLDTIIERQNKIIERQTKATEKLSTIVGIMISLLVCSITAGIIALLIYL